MMSATETTSAPAFGGGVGLSAVFGIVLAIAAGLLSAAFDAPFLTGLWLPGYVFGAPGLFDIGVYLVVFGTMSAVALAGLHGAELLDQRVQPLRQVGVAVQAGGLEALGREADPLAPLPRGSGVTRHHARAGALRRRADRAVEPIARDVVRVGRAGGPDLVEAELLDPVVAEHEGGAGLEHAVRRHLLLDSELPEERDDGGNQRLPDHQRGPLASVEDHRLHAPTGEGGGEGGARGPGPEDRHSPGASRSHEEGA